MRACKSGEARIGVCVVGRVGDRKASERKFDVKAGVWVCE